MTRPTLDDESIFPEAIAARHRTKWSSMLREIIQTNAFYRAKLETLFDAHSPSFAESVQPGELPFTTRSELEANQLDHPPYGTNLTYPLVNYVRFHQTSGSNGSPLRWLDRETDWHWWKRCWASIFIAAGVEPGDVAVFPFSFGPFIGFWAAFESAVWLGLRCLPAGGMTTKARLQYLLDHQATVICCTPTYALRMAEVADEEGIDLRRSPVRTLVVAGEPGGSIPATRNRIETAWGARVFDHAGMTEMGAFAFECVDAPGGLHVNENEFVAEVIDPVTLRPVGDGHVGELVLTNLGRWGMPLIRYRTGDLVRLLHGRCACGRHFARLEGGLLGRRDDMVTIRGNNVFPPAIEAILRHFQDVVEYSVEVDVGGSQTDLHIEIEKTAESDAVALISDITNTIRDRLNFRPVVSIVPSGSLPRYEMKSQRWRRREK